MKAGPRAFQDKELLDAGPYRNAFSLTGDGLDDADLFPVAEERMRVGFVVHIQAGPSVGDNTDMSYVNMLVRVDKVIADYCGKQFRWCDRVLFGKDVASLLLSIGRYNRSIVRFGVSKRY